MDKFIETYGERPDGHGGLPTMATRAQDTWDALRAAYEIGKSEATMRLLPAPDSDKAVSINAIHALLATLPPNA